MAGIDKAYPDHWQNRRTKKTKAQRKARKLEDLEWYWRTWGGSYYDEEKKIWAQYKFLKKISSLQEKYQKKYFKQDKKYSALWTRMCIEGIIPNDEPFLLAYERWIEIFHEEYEEINPPRFIDMGKGKRLAKKYKKAKLDFYIKII